jgi:hypothetical protein
VVAKPFEVEELLASVRQCAGVDEGSSIGSMFCTTTPVLLMLADLLRQLR